MACSFLPPANEVCEGYVFTPVCQSFCSRGRGVPGPGGSGPGGSARWRPPSPQDGHCCGRYTSYWNAFLFKWDFTSVLRIFTAWGKVIFSQACVKNSVHRGGGCLLLGCLLRRVSAPGEGGGVSGGDPPDGYCCGRYASYWNAFLFI